MERSLTTKAVFYKVFPEGLKALHHGLETPLVCRSSIASFEDALMKRSGTGSFGTLAARCMKIRLGPIAGSTFRVIDWWAGYLENAKAISQT
jgi:hypothetical protein